MSLSLSEILVVVIVALVVIKPEQLPEVALKLGRLTKQLRTGMTKLRRELDGAATQLNETTLKSLPEKIEQKNETTRSA